MNKKALITLQLIKDLDQTDLANLSGISRQAVSLWFKTKGDTINVQSKHIFELAKNCHISPAYLMESPFKDFSQEKFSYYNTKFNWDHSYPDIEYFFIALAKKDLRAISRFVQVMGSLSSLELIGDIVWKQFPAYKKYLKPIIRKKMEILWQTLINHNLISL